MEHHFTLRGHWNGGLNGTGRIGVGSIDSDISVPKEMNGPGKGTNPEELLIGAAATCYLITLGAILERRKLSVEKVELSTEGTVNADGGLKFTRLVHRPRVQLAASSTPEQRQTALDATARAEKACLISNAIRGNVEVIVEPTIV